MPISFKFEATDEFVDPRMYLRLQVLLQSENGTPLVAPTFDTERPYGKLTGDTATFISYALMTMWSRIEVFAGNKPITSVQTHHPWTAYLTALLQSDAYKETVLQTAG